MKPHLQALFGAQGLVFDAGSCGRFTTAEGREACLRVVDEDAGVLVALPLGILESLDVDARALLLLSANSLPVLVEGGGFGFDSLTHEVSLSRFFPLGAHVDLAATAAEIALFCNASETAAEFLEHVNSMIIRSDGTVDFPQIDLDQAQQAAARLQGAAEQNPPQQPDQATLTKYNEFLSEALHFANLDFDGLDDLFCWYARADDETLAVRIEFDPVTEYIVLAAIVCTCDATKLSRCAVPWLAANQFVEDTGNCVLSLSGEAPYRVILSLAVPLCSIHPDVIGFGQLITNFLINAERMQLDVEPPLTPPDGPASTCSTGEYNMRFA